MTTTLVDDLHSEHVDLPRVRAMGTEPLPPERYTSPAILGRELRSVFRGNWLIAGRGDDLARPGDYLTFDAIDESVLITRTKAGQLRAMYNVCRHRGSQVASGRGSCEGFTCPYHGWRYDLEGALVNVPDRGDFPALNEARSGLIPVAVDEWGGWVWVHLGTPATSVREWLAEVGEELSRYEPEQMEALHHQSYTIPANWKAILDGFNEVYHVRVTHPRTVAPFLETRATTFELFTDHTMMAVPFKAPPQPAAESTAPKVNVYGDERPRRKDLLPKQRRADCHYVVYPNAVFNMLPHWFQLFLVYPIDVNTSRFETFFFGNKDAGRNERRVNEEQWDEFLRVMEEDLRGLAMVGRGLRSAGFRGVQLNDRECRLRHFHARVDQDLGRES